MFKSIRYRLVSFMLLAGLCAGGFHVTAEAAHTEMTAEDLNYNIVIDPGHGGMDTGAAGYGKSESKRTLKVGLMLKEELEKYDHVNVSMTRTKDEWVNLHDRVKIAKKKKADLVVSLHFDGWSGVGYSNGSSVFVAKKGSYRRNLAKAEALLGRSVLQELEGIGLRNRGLIRKKSANVKRYPDGSLGDYSAIIRDGMKAGIACILIEHAFIDNYEDYILALSSTEKMRKVAHADAMGIVRYLQLRESATGNIPQATVRRGVKLVCDAEQGSDIGLFRKKAAIAEYEKMLEAGAKRFASYREVRFERETAEYEAESKAMAANLREVRARTDETAKCFNVVISLFMAFILYWLILDTHERYGEGPLVDVRKLREDTLLLWSRIVSLTKKVILALWNMICAFGKYVWDGTVSFCLDVRKGSIAIFRGIRRWFSKLIRRIKVTACNIYGMIKKTCRNTLSGTK